MTLTSKPNPGATKSSPQYTFLEALEAAAPPSRFRLPGTVLGAQGIFTTINPYGKYFLDPDNVPNDGIPGTGSPYPRSVNFQPSFNLYPDVYVLPGQVWDVLTVYYSATGCGDGGGLADSGDYRAFVKYTLYDGPDALIANKLLEMGISINPGNVDWYKRSLLSA